MKLNVPSFENLTNPERVLLVKSCLCKESNEELEIEGRIYKKEGSKCFLFYQSHCTGWLIDTLNRLKQLKTGIFRSPSFWKLSKHNAK